jgi:hypothetical protein
MFSKLLKHEWKANWGLLSLLSLAAIGVGLLGTIALRVLVNYVEKIAESDSILILLLLPLGMLVFVSFLALVIYGAAVSFIMLFRFYKNKFTDEGYLTFTLPVKSGQIFLSSALNMLVWMLISLALVFLLFAMMILCGTATEGLVNQNIIESLSNSQWFWNGVDEMFSTIMGESYGVLGFITMLVTPIYSVVLSMSCVTLGAVVAKKHKILAAIGISYAASIVLSIIGNILSSLPSLIFIGNPNPGDEEMQLYFMLAMVMQLLLYVGVTVGGYFLSTGLMKKKLNLP